MGRDVRNWSVRQHAVRLGAALAALSFASCMSAAPDDTATTHAEPEAQVASAADPCDQLSTTGTKLLDLGHDTPILETLQSGQRIASRDARSWRLWDAVTGDTIARGRSDGAIDLVGDTLLTTEAETLQVRSALDGAVRQSFPLSSKKLHARLSNDGAYIYADGDGGITAWDLAGKRLAQAALAIERPFVYPAPGELRIVRSRASTQLEILSLSTGELITAGAYEGEFAAWFVDGEHFVTWVPGGFRVYTKDVRFVQQIPWPHSLRAGFEAGGVGNNVWLYSSGSAGFWFEVYRLGSTAPALTHTRGGTNTRPIVSPRSSVIGISHDASPIGLNQEQGLRLFDLSGDKPSTTFLSAEIIRSVDLVTVDPGGRAVLTSGSRLYVGAMESATSVRALGCGAVVGLAGWRDRLAVSSESGVVRLFSFRSGAPVLRWKLTGAVAYATEFMADGRYLLVRGRFTDPATMREAGQARVFEFDDNDQLLRSLRVDEAISRFTTTYVSAAMNASSYTATTCDSPTASNRRCDVFVRTLDGREWRTGYTTLGGAGTLLAGTPQMSPSGRRLAMPDGEGSAGVSTAIYDGWTRTQTLPGLRLELWLSDDRAVVTDMSSVRQTGKIIDLASATQRTLASAPLGRLRMGGDGTFHDAEYIYRVADGDVLWSLRTATGRRQTTESITTTAAGRFVFVDDDALFAEPYAPAPAPEASEALRATAR